MEKSIIQDIEESFEQGFHCTILRVLAGTLRPGNVVAVFRREDDAPDYSDVPDDKVTEALSLVTVLSLIRALRRQATVTVHYHSECFSAFEVEAVERGTHFTFPNTEILPAHARRLIEAGAQADALALASLGMPVVVLDYSKDS